MDAYRLSVVGQVQIFLNGRKRAFQIAEVGAEFEHGGDARKVEFGVRIDTVLGVQKSV